MARILIVYATIDGQTRKICERLRSVVEADRHQVTHQVTLLPIDEAGGVDALCREQLQRDTGAVLQVRGAVHPAEGALADQHVETVAVADDQSRLRFHEVHAGAHHRPEHGPNARGGARPWAAAGLAESGARNVGCFAL